MQIDVAIGLPNTIPGIEGKQPKLLLGGSVDASFRRAAGHGIGWILGGGTPDQLRDGKEAVEQAWEEAGRDDEPYIGALTYFSLGERALLLPCSSDPEQVDLLREAAL